MQRGVTLLQWLSSKESVCDAGDTGSIPGSQSSSGGGHGNPLQCSCLENPMDTGAWRAKVHGVTQRWTRLSDSAAVAAGSEGREDRRSSLGANLSKHREAVSSRSPSGLRQRLGKNGFGLGMWGERRLKSLWMGRRPSLPLPPWKAPDIVQRGDAVR